eukprot:scaffold57189_cov63-Phaeocystis_antarctica.AAC.2
MLSVAALCWLQERTQPSASLARAVWPKAQRARTRRECGDRGRCWYGLVWGYLDALGGSRCMGWWGAGVGAAAGEGLGFGWGEVWSVPSGCRRRAEARALREPRDTSVIDTRIQRCAPWRLRQARASPRVTEVRASRAQVWCLKARGWASACRGSKRAAARAAARRRAAGLRGRQDGVELPRVLGGEYLVNIG